MGPRIDGSNPTGLNTFGADSSDAPTATVRLGETSLAQVAQRLGLDPDALQQANPKIVDPSKLTVGQELRLPLSMKPPSSVSDSATSPSSIPGPPSDPMAKVMAQMQLGGLPQQSAGPSKPVMFNSPVNAKEKEHDRWLNELGHRPDEAHEAWKNLSPGDRLTVIAKMSNRYGDAFAQQFLQSQQNGSWKKTPISIYSTDPSSKLPHATPEQLKARGFRLAGEDPRGEVWVRPDGELIIRNTMNYHVGDQAPDSKSTTPPTGPSAPKTPPKIDGGDVPPPVKPEDKAWNLLGKMQQQNEELEGLLSQKPVPWDKVHSKVSQIQDEEKAIDKLMNPDDPNATPPLMNDSFYDQLEAAKEDLQKNYDKAAEAKPDFMQGPVVVNPSDDDGD
jgi:LysM domain-containing protein